jgi:hypothetical protein
MLAVFDLWSFDDVEQTPRGSSRLFGRGLDAVRHAVVERQGRSLPTLGRQ